MTVKGKIVFQLANVGSKSEGIYPFLLKEDGSQIKIAFLGDNPFENPTLREYESKDVVLEGEFNEYRKFIAETIEKIVSVEAAEELTEADENGFADDSEIVE